MSITINHQTNDISGVGGSVTINGNAVPTTSLTGVTQSSGSFITSLGAGAGQSGSGGAVTIGYQAGQSNSYGGGGVHIGYQAGKVSIGGNVTIGNSAGLALSYGPYCTIIGTNAGTTISSASRTTIIGAEAGKQCGNVDDLTAIGNMSGFYASGNASTLLGSWAGYYSGGIERVALGAYSMRGSPSWNSTGAYSVGVGAYSLFNYTSGEKNVAIGHSALYSATTSKWNVAIGHNAGYGLTTASDNNVIIGYLAGYTGTNNLTASASNNIIIGASAQATASNANNEITLGNASIASFRIPGLGINWTTSNIPVGIDVLKIDTISTTQAANNTTTAQIGWRTLTSQTLFGQTDGCMYTSTYNTGSMHQIFGDYRTGQVAIRGRESGTWTSWRNVLDSSNHTTYTTGPTFRAFRGTSSQTVSANSWNKVQFNTESWDTDNAFDSTTNYRFTPQKAGYYTVNVNIGCTNQAIVSIWKNGAEYLTAGWASGGSYMSTGGLVYLNGSTDYIEGYVWTDGTVVEASAQGTVFSAIWVRG